MRLLPVSADLPIERGVIAASESGPAPAIDSPCDEAAVKRRDRLANISAFALAAVAWAAVGYVITNYDPRQSAGALLVGAVLLGAAVGLTFAPLLWIAGFVRARNIGYIGDWWKAGRRATLIGLVVTIFVVLRGQDAFSVPLALFVVAMAVLVELTLSLRR
jgi:hypothetical protein